MRAHVRFTILLLCLAVCGLFIACDIGLGFKVNTSVPKIQIPDSDPFSRDIQPGGFLNGSDNDIFIDITHEQGFLITDAFMSIDFTDIDGVKQTAIVNGEYDSVNDKWVFSIDTVALRIADGKIKTRITAVDSSGKKTTTTDIIYSVKNLHPQIEMTIPAIKGGNFDDETFMNDLRSKDPVFVGFDLMGLATDDAGIKLGWPKIMLWPVDDPAVPLDGFGFPAETNLKWGIWRSMVVAQAADGLTATRITWPMKQLENNPVPIKDAQDRLGNTVTDNYRVAEGDSVRLPNGYYRFIMWAKDVFGNDYFYPNRTGSAADWGTTPNIKWIEINHMVSEIPIAVIDEAPDYYNGIGDFTVKFTVNSKTPLASVKLFISDSSSGMGNNSPDYDVPLVTPADGIYSFAVSFSNGEPFNINKWPQAIGNGPLYINIKATDENIKNNPGTYRNFIYDVTPPAVKFERPFNIANPPVTLPVDLKGTFASTNTSYEIYRPSNNPSANPPAGPRWSTGVVTVGGWANDPSTGIPSSGIKEVWYYIGNLGDDAVGITHGQRENIYNNAKWINTNLGGIQPADGWSGNLYTWSYTENFNSFRTTRPGDIQEAAQFGFPDSNNTLDVTADLTGTYDRERFYLPFYVKVLDGSGNTMIIHYKLCIDPNMDIPQVSISYPNEDDLLGGEVRLSGTASDNDWVYTVLIRIQKDGDAGYYLPKNESFFYQIPGNSAFPGFDKDPNGWFEAKITGNIAQVVGWYYNINSDGGLDPKLGDSTVPVKIEVRAIDSKDGVAADSRSLVGPAEIRNIRFSAGVPTISLPQIVKDGVDARNYSDGIKTSGQIKFAFTVRDDEGFSLVRVRINGAPYDVVTNMNKPAAGLSGWIITGPFDDGKDPSRPSCFTIEVPIDTAQYAAVGRTGSLTVDVLVSDNSTPPSTTSASYNLDID
ncbi:MAG: hypothetical protein FWF29_09575, partial [Treponema sp.]|nr:hypothetical protein [Treponema sp.]